MLLCGLDFEDKDFHLDWDVFIDVDDVLASSCVCVPPSSGSDRTQPSTGDGGRGEGVSTDEPGLFWPEVGCQYVESSE